MSAMHDRYAEHAQIRGPSARSFGVTVGGILAAIGLARWLAFDASLLSTLSLMGIGLTLVGLGVIAPRMLAPLNRLWTRLGLLLSRTINPVIMMLMFALVFTPMAVVMRLFGRDALNLKPDRRADSYWDGRHPPGPAPETMINQF